MRVLTRRVACGGAGLHSGLTAGYAVMAVVLIAVSEFALTDAGSVLVVVILEV